MASNKIKRRNDKKEEKRIKNFYVLEIEPATSVNIDKRWGMRSAGTLHAICLARSKTVQRFRKLVDIAMKSREDSIKKE